MNAAAAVLRPVRNPYAAVVTAELNVLSVANAKLVAEVSDIVLRNEYPVRVLVPIPIAPVSSTNDDEFWISLPVVVSKRAIALSVADAGPTTSPPDPDAEIVIDPVPFVIVTPDPAVSVDFVSVLPVVLPISNWPFVYVVSPVPPFATGNVPDTCVVSPILP